MKRPRLAWLRAGRVTADAWVLDKVALLIVPALLVPHGIWFFGWTAPWAYLLPLVGGLVWTRVRVTPEGSTLFRVWAVIPFRHRRFPPGGFSALAGDDTSDAKPSTFAHDSVADDDDGYSAFDARRVAGWLSEQAERLQGASRSRTSKG